MINNILYRNKKNVIIKRLKSENTGLYIVKIFPKEKKENVKKDDDIFFSFNLVNDISHLKNK